MKLEYDDARASDVAELSRLRTAAADRLTEEHGNGHWSSPVTEAGVRRGLPHARVIVARHRESIVGTLRLATKKPWAIDVGYFTRVPKALYLTDMAVDPRHQRRGVGRALLEEADRAARTWPADAIRLDAYDAAAGAGGFYRSCGYREVGRVVYRTVPLVYYERIL